MRLSITIFMVYMIFVPCRFQCQYTVTWPQCPPNYQLIYDRCYYRNPSYNNNYASNCPKGYYLAGNGLCYPIITNTPIQNCANATASSSLSSQMTATTTHFDNFYNNRGSEAITATTSATNTATTTTTTTENNYSEEQQRCPPHSILFDDKCRKIICSLGEYYEGRCLQPACPSGLVWHGKRCQKPAYIITILEMDNIVVNQMNDSNYTIKQNTSNYIPPAIYTTVNRTQPTHLINQINTPTNLSADDYLHKFHLKRNNSRIDFTNSKNAGGNCCNIITPRICRQFGKKWICFSRHQNLCDRRICNATIVYLKAPEIRYKPPLLIMPPNPILNNCTTSDCQSNGSTAIDCSGCIYNKPESCSPYCYHYLCPQGACNFIELKEYCNYYTGKFGCVEEDGCLWNWC